MRMARQVILSICALGVIASTAAEPRPLDNYQSIIDRNPFGLKDPPIVPPVTNTPPPVTTKKDEFYLTGISTVGFPNRPKRAYLVNKDNSKKEYSEKFYTLSVGDRQGDLALMDIDEKQRRVKIAYRGEENWLSMKDNGVPTPSGPVPGAMPLNMPPGMHPGQPQPAGVVPVPLPGAGSPQPNLYPAANSPNRRIPRSTGFNAPAQDSAALGPQTDAELLEQIIKMQNPEKFVNPPSPSAANPNPTNPTNPNPNPTTPTRPPREIPMPPVPTF